MSTDRHPYILRFTTLLLGITIGLPAVLAGLLFFLSPDTSDWHKYRNEQTPSFSQWRSARPAQSNATPGSSDEVGNPELFLQFLGTSSLLISDGETHLLTDGYFSRVSLSEIALGEIAPDPEEIKRVLEKTGISDLDAVMVLHSHFDHAMDSPLVAQLTNAKLVGSSSTLNVGRGMKMPESRLVEAQPGTPIQFGKFELMFYRSNHVPLLHFIEEMTGHNESITQPFSPPAPVSAWKEGQSWTLVIRHPAGNLLIQGSAGYLEEQLKEMETDIDVALISVAGLVKQSSNYINRYFYNLLSNSQAEIVVPLHWDNFFQPLSTNTPPLPWLLDNFPESMELLRQYTDSHHQKLVLLEPWDRMTIQGQETRKLFIETN